MIPFSSATRKKIELTPGYVLHSYPYKDNSLLLNLLTFEQGRVNILARGVKSSKKGLLNQLQPFQALLLSYQLKHDLGIFTGVELDPQHPSRLAGKALYCGYYLNELLLRLLPIQESHEEIYLLYQQTLFQLGVENDLEVVLRRFEVLLLEHLGYQLNLEFDIYSQQPIEAEKKYFFNPQEGPFAIDSAGIVSLPELESGIQQKSSVQKQINHFPQISGQTLLSLRALDFRDKNMVKECKNLLRLVLQQYLGTKPLKSRDLFKQLYGK